MITMMPLTENQKNIYWCSIQGLSIKETALALHRSPNTIREQRRRIRKKMMVSGVVYIGVFLDTKGVVKKTTPDLPQIAPLTDFQPYNIINGYVMRK